MNNSNLIVKISKFLTTSAILSFSRLDISAVVDEAAAVVDGAAAGVDGAAAVVDEAAAVVDGTAVVVELPATSAFAIFLTKYKY